ncbi:MAG: glycosyltransferase family 2 protein [Candidatus Aminicenantes bacterium]
MGCHLSIIIVNWNTRDLLRQCVESIKAHIRNITYQIVVVDNASSDGSAEMVEKSFPEVNLIKNKENQGFGRANNQGLAQAKGKYILFLNSDVKVNARCLDRMFEFMEKNPEVGASSCRLTFPDGSLQHSCRKFPSFKVFFPLVLGLRYFFPRMKVFRDYLMLDWGHSDTREVDQIMGSFMFTRARALRQVGGFDERYWMYFEEVDLCLRMKKAGWKIVHYPDASAVHFLSKSSGQWPETRRILEFQKSLLKYFKKNRKSYEYLILWALSKIKYLFLAPFLKLKEIKKSE